MSENVPVNKDHKQGIYVLYFNARSLLPKMDELRAVCEAAKSTIICIVKTWLDKDIADSELVLSGFHLFRKGSDRHGGGVAMYVSFIWWA